ncbi:MAG: PriCT-2 domain-containing protein [Aquincola tertiaricarbonis]
MSVTSVASAPPAATSLNVTFTVFDDVSAARARQQDLDWPGLVKMIEGNRLYPSKSACPLIKLATFGDRRTPKGSLRSDENLVAVTGVEGDYDGEVMTPREAADRLRTAGITAIVYTSARHGVVTEGRNGSKGGPRWRVLAPLGHACAPDDRRDLVSLLNGVLGGVLSGESWTASQSFYFGRVAGAPFEAHVVEGAPLDLFALWTDLAPIGPPGDEPAAVRVTGNDGFDRESKLHAVTPRVIEDLRTAITRLNPARAADRGSWIIGMHALKSIEQAGYPAEALELVHQFSALDPDAYNPEDVDRKWEMDPRSTTYKTIFGWAKEDGLIAYGKLEDRTDVGNANLLIRLTEGDLRHVPERRLWIWRPARRRRRPSRPATPGRFAICSGWPTARTRRCARCNGRPTPHAPPSSRRCWPRCSRNRCTPPSGG